MKATSDADSARLWFLICRIIFASLAAKNRVLHRSRDAASRGLKKRRTSSAALDHSTSPMARPRRRRRCAGPRLTRRAPAMRSGAAPPKKTSPRALQRIVPTPDPEFLERVQRFIMTHKPGLKERLFLVTPQTVQNRLDKWRQDIELPFHAPRSVSTFNDQTVGAGRDRSDRGMNLRHVVALFFVLAGCAALASHTFHSDKPYAVESVANVYDGDTITIIHNGEFHLDCISSQRVSIRKDAHAPVCCA